MKILIKYLKKIIIGVFVLYAYNLIAASFNMIIPINFFTILIVGLFDFFGLIGIILIKIIGL